MTGRGDIGVRIGLSAVIFVLDGPVLSVLTTHAQEDAPGLPFGPFDPARHRTFELALRAFVTAQTGFRLGFVEQLYRNVLDRPGEAGGVAYWTGLLEDGLASRAIVLAGFAESAENRDALAPVIGTSIWYQDWVA